MSDLPSVFERVESGDKVRFFQNFYGRQWIEVTRGWLLKRKTRVYLADDKIMQVKRALEGCRRVRNGAAPEQVG